MLVDDIFKKGESLQRTNGYVYTIFSLEVSHLSLPRASPQLELAQAQWVGPGSRLASEDY
jgi:hypothetical protein